MDGRNSFGNAGNPLVQALSLLVFALILVGAVIMGAVVLAALIGVAIVAFFALKVRGWWLRRRGRGGGGKGGPGAGSGRTETVRYIEGEYEVIESDAEVERQRSGDRQ
jgi:hypothetical protein